MPKIKLSGMSFEALMDLQNQVDEMLRKHRAEIERQLARLDQAIAGDARAGGSALRGRRVKPKYRGPSGETWAGRGVKPRWLVAAMKSGKKVDDFLIDKGRRKRKRTGNLPDQSSSL